jgi:CDP-diacylglycerol pyrophosphatase
MMTPKTRREREIWQVCDELVAKGMLGNKVTGEAIRDQLLEHGYTKGSPNEIYKYRKNWREARGILAEDYSLPPQGQIVLSDPIARAVESVRTEIRNEAHIEIEEIRRNTQEQVNFFQTKICEIEQELKAELEKNQKLTLELSEYKLESRQLKTQNQEMDIKYSKTKNQMENDNHKICELNTTNRLLESKIENLKGERKNIIEEHKNLEFKLIAAETQLKHFKDHHIVVQGQNFELQQSLQYKLEHIAKLEERNRQLQAIITEKMF